MSIGYTSLLALVQPVDGTEVGTWGDDVNNGVSSILDVAVAGTQNITTDANVTLTITQATSSGTNLSSTSAQYAILLLSGSRTATRTITLPASSKTYTVMNSTTGGYAQTVGGLTIAVGEYCQIAYNTSSSSWVKTSTQSGAGTFSSITNTGLTSGRVVYSTTGGLETDSANLTFDGTNLTLGGGTANGVAYLNGSKVLTTGAALTFDGTNLGVGVTATAPITLRTTSGYLSQDIVGDATNGWSSLRFRNAANNATNVFFNYDNGAFKFGTVNSEPIVFNTANSEQMRLTSTGLGIGTSSPAYKLHAYVSSNATTNIGVFENASTGSGVYSQIRVKGGTNTLTLGLNGSGGTGGAYIGTDQAQGLTLYANGNNLNLNSSGNLGLGVTPSAWYQFYSAFQIGSGSVNSYSTSNNYQVELTSNAYGSGAGSYSYINTSTAGAGRYQLANGSHVWYTAGAGTAGATVSFTQAMTLDNSGNLLIGTTTANSPLTVNGAAKIVSTAYNSGGLVIGTSVGSDDWRIGDSGSSAYALTFSSISGGTATERARIDSSGNLILGATSAFTNANSIALAGTQIVQGHINGTSSGTNYTNFLYNSTSIGSISQNGTSGVLYNTSSDQRLKTDLGTVTSTDVIANTVIHDFTWKTDGSQARGVFAQEAAKVLPAAVKVGDDGEEVTDQWQVDYSKYVPDIIVELQSLRARVAQLETQKG